MHNSKSPEISRRFILELIKNIGRRKHQRGATYHPRGWRARPLPCGLPGTPPMPIFCYMVCFDLKKIKRMLSGRSTAVSWRNLGGTNLGLRRSYLPGKHPSGRGNRHHRHHHRSSHREGVNLHQHLHQHHLLSNPSSSLVSDLCLKTSYWYLWIVVVLITPCS